MANIRVYNIHLAVSASSRDYIYSDKAGANIAAAAFAASAPEIAPEKMIWGKGYIANTESFFAYGAMHLLHEILVEEVDNEDFQVAIYLKNIGTEKYVKTYVWNWLEQNDANNSGKKPNNYETWKQFHSLCALGKVKFVKAEEIEDINKIKELHKLATRLRKKISYCTDDDIEGVKETGFA